MVEGCSDEGTVHSLDEEQWVRSLLHVVNMDHSVGLENTSHPNHHLLVKYPEVAKAFVPSKIEARNDMPAVIPGAGILMEGNYYHDQKDYLVRFDASRFNATCWTLVLRVFVNKDARSIAVFGAGWRWFQVTPINITLNNQEVYYELKQVKTDAWNDIFISFNLPQENTGEVLENTNTRREILAIINGKRVKFDIDPSKTVSIYKENERTQQQEKALTHINYSNAFCFRGLISTEVLFNRSCTSHDELQAVAEMIFKNQQIPRVTYNRTTGAVEEIVEDKEPTVDERVHHPETESEFDDLISKHELVAVDFFADWCGPCMAIAPFFETLADKNPDIAFVKVNVDVLGTIVAKYQVNCMPTFVFLKNGKVQNRLEGASKNLVSQYVDELKK